MATKTTPSPMIGLLFGCKELKVTFGTETDWKAGKKQKTDVLFPDGHIEKRAILWFESFGNFAVAVIRVKGKLRKEFTTTTYIGDEPFYGIILKD
jgi:hypothetical protein